MTPEPATRCSRSTRTRRLIRHRIPRFSRRQPRCRCWGADYRFRTTMWSPARSVSASSPDTLDGSLFLQGSGDPSLQPADIVDLVRDFVAAESSTYKRRHHSRRRISQRHRSGTSSDGTRARQRSPLLNRDAYRVPRLGIERRSSCPRHHRAIVAIFSFCDRR